MNSAQFKFCLPITEYWPVDLPKFSTTFDDLPKFSSSKMFPSTVVDVVVDEPSL